MSKSRLITIFSLFIAAFFLAGCGGLVNLKKSMASKPSTEVVIHAKVQTESMANKAIEGSVFKKVAKEAVNAIKAEYKGIEVSVYDKDLPMNSIGMIDFKAIGDVVCYINLTFKLSIKFGNELSVAPIVQFLRKGSYLHGGKSLDWIKVKVPKKVMKKYNKNGDLGVLISFIKKEFPGKLAPAVAKGIKEYLTEAKAAK